MVRRTPWAAVVIALATLSSGCQASPEPGDGGPSASASEPDPFAAPPTWRVGQWWNYSTEGGQAGGGMSLIVVEEDADSYIMGTDSHGTAAFQAEEPISFMGPIGKEDLSGDQGGLTVQYFKFPLTAGENWTTTWDGEERTVRAIGPEGNEFMLEAYAGETLRVEYSYDAESGNVGYSTFHDADGTFTRRLAQHGQNYTGPLVSATWDVAVEAERINETAAAEDFPFDVVDGVGDLVFRLDLSCTHPGGSWDVLLGRPDSFVDEQGVIDQGTCPGLRDYEEILVAPPPGEWHATFRWTPIMPPSHFEIEVGLRTFTVTQFPA